MLHEPDEAPVELLISFDLVLKLAFLVTIQLLFVHRESQTIYKRLKVLVEADHSILQVLTRLTIRCILIHRDRTSPLKGKTLLLDELLLRFHIAKQVQFPINQLDTMPQLISLLLQKDMPRRHISLLNEAQCFVHLT